MSFKAKFLSDKDFILFQSSVIFVLAFSIRIAFYIYRGSFNSNMTTVLCASLWLFNLLIYLPLWIEHRFWTPVIPFQLVSAGVGFTVLKEWVLRRREKSAKVLELLKGSE
ncbi:MAG: hypothetical protein ABIO36_02655 [Pyrinomonadaceae bacterium]